LADRFRRGGRQQGVDDIGDVYTVASLRTVTEDEDLLAQQPLADEHGEKAELVAVQSLPGSVDVGEPQAGGGHSVGRVVDEVQLLAGQLGDTVDIHRTGR